MDFIFDPNLVLYLPLYRLDGASFMSGDKHGHLCTVTGAIWTPRGRNFDGIDDKIVAPSYFGDVNMKATKFSVSLWIKLLSWSNWGAILLIKPTTGTNFCFQLIHRDTGELQVVWIRADGNLTGRVCLKGSSLTLNTFHHIVVTYDGSDAPSANTVKVYLNGAEDTLTETAGATTPVLAANNSITLGYLGNDFPLDGIIGEALVHSQLLNYPENQNHRLATKWRYQ